MRATALLVALTITAVGCGEGENADLVLGTNFELLRNHMYRRSTTRYENIDRALVDTCCPNRRWALLESPLPEADAACWALQRAIEQRPTTDNLSWGPHCTNTISTEALLGALASAEGDVLHALLTRLSEREPSPRAQRAIFDRLVRAVSRGDDVSKYAVTLAIGGEPEIREIISRFESADPRVRRTAAYILALATTLPLQLPELGQQLERLVTDNDPEVRGLAQVAADQHRTWVHGDLDAWAGVAAGAHVPDENGVWPTTHAGLAGLLHQDVDEKLLPIQVFGRRLAFCRSRLATTALAMMERESDGYYADLARRASVLRTKRCGKTLAGLPRRPD